MTFNYQWLLSCSLFKLVMQSRKERDIPFDAVPLTRIISLKIKVASMLRESPTTGGQQLPWAANSHLLGTSH